jgi:hypothetical protein
LLGSLAMATVASAATGYLVSRPVRASAAPRRAPIPAVECPGGPEVTTLQRGDRVLATARDASGEWVQIRDPAQPERSVWIAAKQFDPDRDSMGTLPIASCLQTSAQALPTPPSPAPSTTHLPTRSPKPPSAPSTDSSGSAHDTTGPTVTGVGSDVTDIWEAGDAYGGKCASQTHAMIHASVTDRSGVATVTMSWSYGGHSGSAPMSGAAHRSVAIGPFPFPADVPAAGVDVKVTLDATDTAGNRTVKSLSIHLHSASECVG